MLDPYASSLNDIITSIYDSVNHVESQMLSKSVPDLSIGELHIIETIWKMRDGDCSIGDIALARRVTMPSMTVAIKKLEKKGYVKKTRCDTDGRVVHVVLTRTGQRVNAMHRYFHEHMVRSFLTDVENGQRPVLLSALKNMDSYLKRQLEKIDT